jgi:hypothetical protein
MGARQGRKKGPTMVINHSQQHPNHHKKQHPNYKRKSPNVTPQRRI